MRTGRILPKEEPGNANEPAVAEHEDYDSQGRLKLHTDFAGQVTEYTYDNLGSVSVKRLFAVNAYQNGTGTPGETISYEYDNLGRQTKITDESSGRHAGEHLHV